MSEKRFTIHKESKYKEEWYAYPFCIKEDGEVVLETIPLSIAEKVRDKLNEQQATITNLQGDVERLKYIIEELRKDNYNKFELINKMKKEEKLYAKEILRLNELNKQINNFNRLCGGY